MDNLTPEEAMKIIEDFRPTAEELVQDGEGRWHDTFGGGGFYVERGPYTPEESAERLERDLRYQPGLSQIVTIETWNAWVQMQGSGWCETITLCPDGDGLLWIGSTKILITGYCKWFEKHKLEVE